MTTLTTWFLYFVIYSMIGWIYESTVESIMGQKLVNRGYLTGPWIPIYGFGGVLAVLILSPYLEMNVYLLFVLAGAVACVLEYFTSWAMEKLFDTRWWDYTNWPFNVNGRVCLVGFIAFGILLVVVLHYVHPFVMMLVAAIPRFWRSVIAGILFLLLFADTVTTTAGIIQFKHKLDRVQYAINKATEKYSTQLGEIQGQIVGRLRDTWDTNEWRRKVAQQLEQSEFYTEAIKKLLAHQKWQEKRLIRAFPNLQSLRNGDALEHLKWLQRRQAKRKKNKQDPPQQ